MIKNILFSSLFSLFTIFSPITRATSENENAEKTPRFAIHLLDYLAHDYGGAVEHGKVISAGEYDEQKEFAGKIYELGQNLPEIKNDPKTLAKIVKLKSLIDSKAEAVDVALTARDIQKDLIILTNIVLSPTDAPSLTNGKQLFLQNCTSCHGLEGHGDGASGKGMDPAPANFHEPERMSAISAFHNYNTIRLGVPGTGMPGWSQFSDKEVWDLSFYLMAMRHTNLLSTLKTITPSQTGTISLVDLATLSDVELKNKMRDGDDAQKTMALALLRSKDNNSTGGDYIGKANAYLLESLSAYKKGGKDSKDNAKRLAIQAYLEGIEPIEPMIKANSPELVEKIETEMGKIRKIIDDPNGSSEQFSAQLTQTFEVFETVKESIKSRDLSFGVAFSGAFAIILREGFEAVLIILTLLSVLKAFGNRKAALYVHAGWSSALFLGFVAWFLSGTLMKLSGASREVLEAATSTIAVFILLYFGFWLHRQTEIGRWKKFIQDKVQGAIDNKNLWALASISFISVFREAFETVLFIRALWFQTNADGKNAISLGLVTALVVIFSLSALALRYSKKIPVRELFKASSIMTSLLALILAGKAVHSLQEAGVLNVTSLPWNIRFDTIGLFPTWQTLSAQMLTFIFAIVLINVNTKIKTDQATL